MAGQYKQIQNARWWQKRIAFLKSIGFEIPFILNFNQNCGEQPKVIIKTSRRLALIRCSIHIIPCLVSITVLSLNLGNSYLGRGLPGSIIDPSINIALLQVAAKIQELLIVGSMTVVVMHVLRAELISGEGLPLGLLGGGFLYSSLGYFWSPDFRGALRAKRSKISKWRVFGILTLGGLVALFAGPSTAVLLVPREQLWPAGGTAMYVPTAPNLWWPTVLNSNSSSTGDLCLSTSNTQSAVCPSGGYMAMLSTSNSLSVLGKAAYVEGSQRNLTSAFSYGPRTVDIQSNLSLLPTMRYHGNYRGYACETSISGPRLGNAVSQAQLKADWIEEAFAIPYNIIRYGPSLSQYKYFGSMRVTTQTYIPTVRATCSSPQILSSSLNTVRFPVLPTNACWNKVGETIDMNFTSIRDDTQGASRLTWVELPNNPGTASAGLVLELPSTEQGSSNGAQAMVACSFDARWTPGKVITYHLEEASSLENVATQIVVTTSELAEPVPATAWVPGYSEFQTVIKNNQSSRISIGRSWLETLTPRMTNATPTEAGQNVKTLDRIIDSTGLLYGLVGTAEDVKSQWETGIAGKVNRTVALEWWISLIVTDGLAREGGSKIIGTTNNTDQWSLLDYQRLPNFRDKLFANKDALAVPNVQDIIEEHSDVSIEGYAYRATSITDFSSVALLLIHFLVAFIHTCHAVWTKRSSSSWDSLTELLVLMQNSKPATKTLRNTNAGINDLHTYSKRANVRAVRHQNDPDREVVELIFEEDDYTAGRMIGESAGRTFEDNINEEGGIMIMEHMAEGAPIRLRTEQNIQGSWTFPLPVDDRGARKLPSRRGRSESTEQLIPGVMRRPTEVSTRIHEDQYYG